MASRVVQLREGRSGGWRCPLCPWRGDYAHLVDHALVGHRHDDDGERWPVLEVLSGALGEVVAIIRTFGAPGRPRPGRPWRLLAHERAGKRRSHHVESEPMPHSGSPYTVVHELAGTEFDELAVSQFLHVEQMHANGWWADIGGVRVDVRTGLDGKAREVFVALEDAEPGCRYVLRPGGPWEEAGDG